MLKWLGLSSSKFYDWKKRKGQPNRHNAKVPKDGWLLPWEKTRILDFQERFPEEGYRRLTYMMIDADEVAASPSSVYRVLSEAGRLKPWGQRDSKKGEGFEHPKKSHEHWHVDISYLNVCGTFYYLFSILDGYSRAILAWDIREAMKEVDVEIILQRAREKFPDARPRIISDNGPQFIARDFKDFIRLGGMTHVKTSPYYPESNGKIERWHKTLKSECIRPRTPLSLQDAKRLVGEFVHEYNTIRLHSAIGYIAPQDKLEGRQEAIFAERKRKLREAQKRRNLYRGILRRTAPLGQALDSRLTGAMS
jgi:transposase InsO family protein